VVVKESRLTSPAETTAFRLGLLGTLVADRFAARVEELGLKPKHAGLLTAVDRLGPASQQEVAAIMGVAPSLIVLFADHLEGMGVIERVRDPQDRRRQVLTLTPDGRRLLARCAQLADEVGREFTAELTAQQRATLDTILESLMRRHVAGGAAGTQQR
jgi:DNA-binding MarR family transcriptional regulator